ncbi:transposase [Patescibacteria group bacterium]|nr:transposase [Patescibacteria group bacterium]
MKYKNRPPHLFIDKCYYFLTARTLGGKNFFNNNEKKMILLNVIKCAADKYDVKLVAWVVLDNHYHLIIKFINSNKLIRFVTNIHVNSSRLLNKFDDTTGRKVWWNYWDRYIRDERDFWIHFNYIHHNPVKHRYARDSKDYQFSSYHYWLNKEGKEWLDSCFAEYPIVDYTS